MTLRAALVALGLLCGCAGTPLRPVSVERSDFAIRMTAPASVESGADSPIAIAIEGRGGFHVNVEYPMHIELTGSDGTVLDKSALSASDALELSEQRARFETRARFGKAGRQQLTARARFAVCTPDTCVPREETLAATIQVR